VLDTSGRVRGRYDVGIKNGQIAALLPTIPPDRATHRIDVTGRLVTPGLVDLHAHYYHSMGLGLPADELVPITATMTGVSAGAAGDMTFSGLRRWVIPQTWTRRFAFVHISSIGLAAGLTPPEMLNIDYADVNGCAKIVAENGDLVLGRRPTWRSSI